MNLFQEKLNGFVQKTFFKKKYIQMSQMLYIKSIEKALKQLNEQNNNDNMIKYTVLILDFHLKKNIEASLSQYLNFMEEKASYFTNVSSLYVNLGQTGSNFTLLMNFLKPFCNNHAQQKIKYLNIEFSENNTNKDTPQFLANCVNLEGICLNFNNSQLPICQIFENITLLAVKSLHYHICQNNFNFFRTMFSRRFYFDCLQELNLNLSSSKQTVQHKQQIFQYQLFIKSECQSIDKQLLMNISQSLQKASKLKQLCLNFEKNSIKDRDLLLLQDTFSNLPSLQNLQLYFAFNQISDEGIEYLLEKFNCTSLVVYLYFDFRINKQLQNNINRQNNISSIGYLNIKSILNRMPKLSYAYLNFNGNSIEQDGVDHFFSNTDFFTNLTHLSLDFSNCQISSKSEINIETSLQMLSKNLTYLSLNFCNNYLEAQGMQKILCAIKNSTLLKHLEINFNWNICNIKDEFTIKNTMQANQNNGSQDEMGDEIDKNVNWLSDIAGLLQNNRNELKHFSLQLANCLVESLGIEYLSKGLAHCINLQILNLNLMNNQIDSSGYMHLFGSIKNMSLTSLKIIIDDNHPLNSKEVQELEKNLKVQKNLREFYFSSRKVEFQSDSFKTFSRGFNNLQKLNFLHLDLKLSKISYKYTSDLCNILVCSKHLNRIHFDISENGFDADTMGEIFKNIQKNKNLKYLTFYAQQILQKKRRGYFILILLVQHKGVQSLAKNSGLKKLKYLDLNLLNCEIENKGLAELAQFLQQFRHLHSLKINLWNNSINNTQTDNLIQFINSLSNLDYLSLNIGQLYNKVQYIIIPLFKNRENEFNDEDLVKIYQALEKKYQLSYLELNLINISKGQESRNQLRKSLEKMSNIKYCNVIPFQSNLKQELIFHEIKLSPLNETQVSSFSFQSAGQYYASGHGQYNLIRFLKNPDYFEDNLIFENIVDGEMLDNLFQHLPKNIQSIHLMNMNQQVVASLQQRLQAANSRAVIYQSGLNGFSIQPQLQVQKNLDWNQSDKIKENDKSQFKKQSNTIVQYDIEDQASNIKESDTSMANSQLIEENINNQQPQRKLNEFQQLVKVQVSNLQLPDVGQIKTRFIKTTDCYDISPNYGIFYDTQTQTYVAIKYKQLDNFIQNQIDAHDQLHNIFQMHVKNFTQILLLKHYFIDSQDYYCITKAPKITLKNLIRHQDQHFEEEKCVKWFINIVDGLVQLESILNLQNLSFDILNLGLDDSDQIVFMDIGNNVNVLEKKMEQFLKQYKQKTIDLAIILFDFKQNDFNYLIFSIGIIFLQIMSLDTDIKLIEKQYYSTKIEDLLFISYQTQNEQQQYENENEHSQNYFQNARTLSNAQKSQNFLPKQQKKNQYSSTLIQLVQDCIFHQDVQKFKLANINLQYVQSQLNLVLSLLNEKQ